MAKGYVGAPTSYTPVEYIESTGTQYIDTGVTGTYSTARFEIEFALTQTVSSTEQTFIGDKNSSGPGTTIFSQSANNLNLYTWSGSGTAYQIGTMVLNAKNILDLTFTSPSGRSGTFNSTNFSSSISNNATSNSESFTIFSSKPNVLDTPAYAKLYSLKIHINGTLVRNYLPILDNNNVACLYDLVEGKFYYNKGTGTFVAGSTTGQPVSIGSRARKLKKGYVGIPINYTPIEYIESSGTQYIDTGVVMTSNISSEIDFQLSAITSAAHNSIITSFVDGTQKGFVFAQRSNNSNFAYAFGAGWNGTEVAANLTRHIAQVNLNGKCYLDNQILVSATGSAGLNSNLNILLCAWHDGGGSQANRFGYLKIYSCKIWDGNTLVRDFIPVVDDNNVACLYEQVEGKFYYNKGTGTFTAGTATGQPVLLSKAREIKKVYVGVNGVARLCWSSGYLWEDFHQFLIYCKANVTTYRNGYMSGVINTLVNNWSTLETKMQEKGVSTDGYKNFWLYYSGGNNHPVIQMSKEDVSYECLSNGYWMIPSPTTYLRFDFNYNDVSSITETTTTANYSMNSVGIFSAEPTNGDYYTTQLQNIWIR